MILVLAIIGCLFILYMLGRINLYIQFNKEVKQLFAQSKPISDRIFTYAMLEGLPEPVQKYFKYVLKEGQPYISYIRLRHDGQFKTGIDKDWVNIMGEQYFTTEVPGYIWKGTTNLFTARDMYIGGKGRLIVTLFSMINIIDDKGEQYNQGELLRCLGESVWFPTNLLPSERLRWFTIDAQNARLTFDYKGMRLFYILTFNEIGEITQFETKRYMGNENLETWIGKLSDYRVMNGIKVPSRIEAIWRLEKGDFSYAKFNVNVLEYENPHRF